MTNKRVDCDIPSYTGHLLITTSAGYDLVAQFLEAKRKLPDSAPREEVQAKNRSDLACYFSWIEECHIERQEEKITVDNFIAIPIPQSILFIAFLVNAINEIAFGEPALPNE